MVDVIPAEVRIKQLARETIARELCRMAGHNPELEWHAWLAEADRIVFAMKAKNLQVTERA